MSEDHETWKRRVSIHCKAKAFSEARDATGKVYFASAFDSDFEKVSEWQPLPAHPDTQEKAP